MEYVFVVVSAETDILGVFDTEYEAVGFISKEQLEWPIMDRPEFFIEQVRKY